MIWQLRSYRELLYRINMRNTDIELERFLDLLTAEARAGDCLPTVRELMPRFGLSQAVVQRVFHRVKDRGTIEIRPGRGIFFLTPDVAPGTGIHSR
jgi:DNA-binding FadR family transcriptional regulator